MLAGFSESVVIVFREGLECVLLLSALAAFLVKSNLRDRMGFLYAGAALGGLASLAFAFGLRALSNTKPALVFGSLLSLTGALVMIYSSGWIWAGRGPGRFSRFVYAQIEKARPTGYLVAAIAALMALRDCVEMVLFLSALARGPGVSSAGITGGIIVAALVLLTIFGVARLAMFRLPLRLFFSLTSACLFLMGLSLIGEAMGELQKGHLIPGTLAAGAPWLDAIGLNPTWEAVVVQIMLIALAATGFLAFLRKREIA